MEKTNVIHGITITRNYDDNGKLESVNIERSREDDDIEEMIRGKLGTKLIMKVISKLMS